MTKGPLVVVTIFAVILVMTVWQEVAETGGSNLGSPNVDASATEAAETGASDMVLIARMRGDSGNNSEKVVELFEDAEGGYILKDNLDLGWYPEGQQLVEVPSELGRRFELRDRWDALDISSELRAFAQVKLDEYLEFRWSASFRERGFASTSPHHSWIKSVEALYGVDKGTRDEFTLLATLRSLGLSSIWYPDDPQGEARHLRFLREQLWEGEADLWWALKPSGSFEEWDRGELKATYR
jgi:hypothetical protein